MWSQRFYVIIFGFTASFFFVFSLIPSSSVCSSLTSSNFLYQGAFRLPDDFNWGARGMSFYAVGNSGAGSLLITGSEALRTSSGEGCYEGLSGCNAYFAEVAIPSPAKETDWTALPMASMLRPMTVFDGGLAATVHQANAFVTGIQYVPMQGSQTEDKIYGSLNEWYPEGDYGDDSFPTVWFSNLDGSIAQGMLHVGPTDSPLYHGRKMGEYLFSVPQWYADQYLGGRTLITGRSRGTPAGESTELTTSGGSQGPTLFAFSPAQSDSPGPTLDALPLLYYRVKYPGCAGPDVGAGGSATDCDYPSFSMCDSWNGGSFVGDRTKNSILLAGHKGATNCYYCDETGEDPECSVDPPPAECSLFCNEDRGYHCGPYRRQVIFYDTTELGAAAQGSTDPWTILPYTTWEPSEFYLQGEDNVCSDVGGMAYDSENSRLFIIERGLGGFQGDNAAVVHVWTVNPTTTESGFCDPLPPPPDTAETISTAAALIDRAYNAPAGSTLLVSAGTYDLTATLHIDNNDITIRGSTGQRDDVILDFGGMSGGYFGTLVTGNDVTIADLTIRNANDHGVSINGVDRPLLYNLHIQDIGDQLVKVNPVGDGSDDGVLGCSLLEYTTTAPDNYTNGISAHNTHRWKVHDNIWRRIRPLDGTTPLPTILFWSGSSDTIVERNLLVDCIQGISFGNASHGADDHSGGIVRNNIIYSTAPHDVTIEMIHASDWLVAHNTLLLLNPIDGLDWGMEARYDDTNGTFINNLSNMRIWQDRDGALATATDNVISATTSWFADLRFEDFRLKQSATIAIDQGDPVTAVTTDWEGQLRDSQPDAGADEWQPSLVEIITLLQVLSGQDKNAPITGDITGDSRTGLEEVIMILRKIGPI